MNFPGLQGELEGGKVTHLLLIFSAEGCDRSIGCGLNGVGFENSPIDSEQLIEFLSIPPNGRDKDATDYDRYSAPFTLFGPGSIKHAYMLEIKAITPVNMADVKARHSGDLTNNDRKAQLRNIRKKWFEALSEEFANEVI